MQNDDFWKAFKKYEQSTLLGLAFRIINNPNKVIGETSDNDERKFRIALYQFLNNHIEKIIEELSQRDIDSKFTDELIKLVENTLDRTGSYEKDLYIVKNWYANRKRDDLDVIYEALLWNAKFYEDYTNIDSLQQYFETKGILLSEEELKAFFGIYNHIVLIPYINLDNSPKALKAWLIDNDCPEDMAEAMVDPLLNDELMTRLIALAKVCKKINSIEKQNQAMIEKFDALIQKIGELLNMASGEPGGGMYR